VTIPVCSLVAGKFVVAAAIFMPDTDDVKKACFLIPRNTFSTVQVDKTYTQNGISSPHAPRGLLVENTRSIY
jgi:hypothetical protein